MGGGLGSWWLLRDGVGGGYGFVGREGGLKHGGRPVGPCALKAPEPFGPIALAPAEGVRLVAKHHLVEVLAGQPGNRDAAHPASPNHRAEHARGGSLERADGTDPGDGRGGRPGGRRLQHGRQFRRRHARASRGRGEGFFQRGSRSAPGQSGPQGLDYIIRDQFAIPRQGFGCILPSVHCGECPLVRGGRLLHHAADGQPHVGFVAPPDLREGFVDRGGDGGDDVGIGHGDGRRLDRARLLRAVFQCPAGDLVHRAPLSPEIVASGASTIGYQSRSGMSPAARKPSRARSVMSLCIRNSKRGSST